MRTKVSLTGLLVGALLAACVPGAQEHENALRGQVVVGNPIPESLLLRSMERNRVPAVSIAVMRGGEIDWAKGYGVRQAGGVDPVDEETLFQAASISKPVTAAGALRMGRLKIDRQKPDLGVFELMRVELQGLNGPLSSFSYTDCYHDHRSAAEGSHQAR